MPFAFKIQTKLLSMEFSALHSLSLCLSPFLQASTQKLGPSKPRAIPLNTGLLLSATLLPLLNTYLFLKNIWNVYAGMVLVLYTYVIISNPPNNPMVLAEFAEAHTGNKELNRDSNLPDPSARSLCIKQDASLQNCTYVSSLPSQPCPLSLPALRQTAWAFL